MARVISMLHKPRPAEMYAVMKSYHVVGSEK